MDDLDPIAELRRSAEERAGGETGRARIGARWAAWASWRPPLPRRRPRVAPPPTEPSSPIAAAAPRPDPALQRELILEANERRALADRVARYGTDHVDVASMAHIIATRCAARGEYHEARRLYERALATYEAHFGSDHPEVVAVLNDLAELHASAGHDDEAAACLARAAYIASTRTTSMRSSSPSKSAAFRV